jgi:hypothetical protein
MEAAGAVVVNERKELLRRIQKLTEQSAALIRQHRAIVDKMRRANQRLAELDRSKKPSTQL